MGAGLVMHRYVIPLAKLKPIELCGRLIYHKMNVERNVGRGVEPLHKIGAESVVRHINAVHYVDVKVLYVSLLELFKLIAEVHKIGAHQRG